MFEIICALILGVVEGLTEFLPISSTAHLIIVGNWLGFSGQKADTFEVFIQLGAILAVVVLYADRFRELVDFKNLDQGPGFRGIEGLKTIAVACLPVFVIGFLLHHAIKTYLFYRVPVCAALVAGGIVLMFIERAGLTVETTEIDKLTLKQALGVGIAQCFALWPGMSRSGCTIVGGMLAGVEKKVAAEFSFIISVPVMVAATGLDMFKSIKFLTPSDIPIFAIGFVVAFFTAMLAIRTFLDLLKRWSLAPYGAYRILIGIMVLRYF